MKARAKAFTPSFLPGGVSDSTALRGAVQLDPQKLAKKDDKALAKDNIEPSN
jgi:hypothetical protein